MADLQAIANAVLSYATETNRFITPHDVRDPIQPAPSAMAQDVFSDFYFEFLNALANATITASVPFEGLRACRIWRDVCLLVLHNQ